MSEERFTLLASWRHSGFSVYFRRRVRARAGEELEQLARYIRRCPIALKRITCQDPESGEESIIYRSGRAPHPRHKANFRVFEPVEFVAEVLQHVPDPWRHESIAYGEYANAARGKRRRQGAAAPESEPCPLRDATLRARWRDLLRHIFLVDPLSCCRCGGRLYLVEVVTNPYHVEALLRALGLWHGRSPPAPPRSGGPPAPAPQPENQHDAECAPQHADDDESQVPPDWDQD